MFWHVVLNSIDTELTYFMPRIQEVTIHGLLLATATGSAQGNRRGGQIIPGQQSGPVTVIVTPIDAPTSLEDLTKKADLIVDGTVATVLPSNSLSPMNPYSIETDSLITVRRVLGGTLDSPNRTLAIAQIGGRIGSAESVVQDDPLLKPGDRYIFFLQPDGRTTVANASGSPRYVVLGVWSGKAKIEAGKIQFVERAGPQLRTRNGMDEDSFIAYVEKLRSAKDKGK
jgi:hypothetical protein